MNLVPHASLISEPTTLKLLATILRLLKAWEWSQYEYTESRNYKDLNLVAEFASCQLLYNISSKD